MLWDSTINGLSFSWIRNTENILSTLEISDVLLSRNFSSVSYKKLIVILPHHQRVKMMLFVRKTYFNNIFYNLTRTFMDKRI